MKIWFLTEERPKIEVLEKIIQCLNRDYELNIKYNHLKIIPIFKDSKFQFEYSILGTNMEMSLFIIEGAQGSFLDYLIFYQNHKPDDESVPLYAIEETKTTTHESRNVAVFQRLTKFVFIDLFNNMKQAKKIMLYSIRTPFHTIPKTFVFGLQVMKTMNIEIIGLEQDPPKFKSLDELMMAKNSFATNRSDNVPISMRVKDSDLIITGKLEKSGRLGHDPNIGTITGLAKCAKTLDYSIGNIIISQHGLKQKMIQNSRNKFIKIASTLGIILEGLQMQPTKIDGPYWRYSTQGEKISSIFFHLILELQKFKIIYENHAGCEQGYFVNPDGNLKAIEKITKKPDLIFLNHDVKEIYLIEAEQSKNVFQSKSGIKQLVGFDKVEKDYCNKYYDYDCKRYVIFYGDKISKKEIDNPNILFGLTTDGSVLFSKYCPNWIKDLFKQS